MRSYLLAAWLGALCFWAANVMAQDLVPPVGQPAAGPAPTPMPLPAVDDVDGKGPHALTRQDLAAWLDGFMPYAIGRGDIPGAVVVVVRNGEVLLQKGYGYSDVAKRTPVDPATTLFRPGSVSKLFTWTAVMQLVEQGKLDLDADVNIYLDFKIPPYDGKPVTMRNIMTHTSGIEEHARGLITSNSGDTIPLDQYVKLVPTRIYAPGSTPSYSNWATTLAGYMVQRVSGQPFDDYVDQHLFAPLGMKHASFRQPLPESLRSSMSMGYEPGVDAPRAFEIVNPAPAGSLAASGADIARFMIAHLQDGAFEDRRILRDETAKRMHGSALTLLPPLNRMVLGFYENNIDGHRVITHAGDTQWFHSDLYLFLDDGIGLFVSFNSAGKDGVAGKIRSTLFKSFARRYLSVPSVDKARVDADTAKRHALQMAGLYENSRRADDTFLSPLNLISQTEVVADGKGSISVPSLTDLGGQPIEWVEVAPYLWRDANGTDRLAAKVVDGKVRRFGVEPVSPFMVFEPVPWWRSAAWLKPALILALLALSLTVLAWPVSRFVRRHYARPYALSGRDARAHRAIRLTALAVLATFVVAAGTIVTMVGSFDLLVPRNDWIVHTLRLLSLLVFPAGVLVSLWNVWSVLRSRRRRWAKVWAIVLALSCLVIAWAAFAFGLPGYSANY